MGVRQECVPVSSFFNTSVDWILSRALEQRHCEASNGSSRVTGLVFIDVLIFADSLKVLLLVREILDEEELRLLGQDQGARIYWKNTGWQKKKSLPLSHDEILEDFTHLGS